MREYNRREECGGKLIKVKNVKKMTNVNKLKKLLSNISISQYAPKEVKKPFVLKH